MTWLIVAGDLTPLGGMDAANHALAATTFRPPMGALFPGARVSFAVMASPARCVLFTASGDRFCSLVFCSGVAGASIRV